VIGADSPTDKGIRYLVKMALLAAFVVTTFFAATTAQTFNDGAPAGDYESYGALR
jgi:hypothetical protein